MKKIILLFTSFLFCASLFSQEEVKLKNGRTIIVNINGTWIFKQDNSDNKTFTDIRDGHVYKTVTIGTQTWFAENLAFKPSEGLYWSLYNDPNNIARYGYLYEWKTSYIVCPRGWHIPSDAEWTILTNYLGGENLAGGKMKSLTGWNSPNTRASNSSGFSALPCSSIGSFGDSGDQFESPGMRADFWASSTDSESVCIRVLRYDEENLNRYEIIPSNTRGLSIRCIKDK